LEAGTASERDVKASDADLAEAELGLSRADAGASLAHANLNRVLGRESGSPLRIATALEPQTFAGDLAAAQQLAVRQRAEIKLLDENLAAARAGVSLAAAQNSPTLSARAIGAAQTQTALTDSKFFAAGLAISWSPFDEGKTRSDVREARARVAQLQALREDAILGIKLEVEKAWREIRTAEERVKVASRQAASAEAALDVSRVRYEAGSATQLEVSGSLFGVVKARANRAQAKSDLLLAHDDFQYAVGMLAPGSLPSRGKDPGP
jgi:outer membrane protein